MDFSKIFSQSVAAQGPSGYGPVEHLRYLRERRGEKIVAQDPDSGLLLGWIGLFPDKDEGGLFYHLAGIEVHADHRGRGIGSRLMEEAGVYLKDRKTSRLRFGTSPLLTRCAGLYVSRFGARYRWKGGVRGPDGRPWPYVAGELDFEDSLFKPLDLRDDEIEERNVLDWDGRRPVPRKGIAYSGPLSIVLPEFSRAALTEAMDGVPGFLETVYDAFEALFLHGYGFAWFDRLARGAASRCYYVMKKLLAL
jgi:GNAT superfamily N-acetyltransferase